MLAKIADMYGPIGERAHLAREVAAHRRRWRAADRIGATLYAMDGGEWAYQHRDPARPRKRTHAALVSVLVGGVRVKVNGRALPIKWRADPRRTADRMSDCERTWRMGATRSGKLSEIVHTCGQATCPVCLYRSAGEDVPDLVAALAHYVAAGCTIVHLTSTQRTDVDGPAGPVVLTDAEAAHVPHERRATPEDTDGSATGREPLTDSWSRLYRSLRLSTDGAAGEWWHDAVLIEIRGEECTQRDPTGRLNRWHNHAHRTLVLAPHVEIQTKATDEGEIVTGGAWWESTVDRWCEVSPGAERWAQRCRVVARPGGESAELTRALRQTLKYAGDVPSMTAAGVVEFLAAVKGKHTHTRAGDMHATGGAGRTLRALAAWQATAEGRTARKGVQLARILDRMKIATAEDAARVRAGLVERRGAPCTDAGIAAWLHLLTVPELPEGAEVPEPIEGTAITRTRSRAVLLTRARLARWAAVGASLWVAVIDGHHVSDRSVARTLRDGARPRWHRITAAALREGDVCIPWTPTEPDEPDG